VMPCLLCQQAVCPLLLARRPFAATVSLSRTPPLGIRGDGSVRKEWWREGDEGKSIPNLKIWYPKHELVFFLKLNYIQQFHVYSNVSFCIELIQYIIWFGIGQFNVRHSNIYIQMKPKPYICSRTKGIRRWYWRWTVSLWLICWNLTWASAKMWLP
jgi:hypothetical protein